MLGEICLKVALFIHCSPNSVAGFEGKKEGKGKKKGIGDGRANMRLSSRRRTTRHSVSGSTCCKRMWTFGAIKMRQSNAPSTLATMSKQRSTLSKGRNFNAKLVRHCCRFWQQCRTLLRHCCWCGPGLTKLDSN